MLLIILGLATGVSFALLRCTALQLVAVSALIAAAGLLAGIAFSIRPAVIAAEILGSITTLQFSFVAVSLTRHLTRSLTLIPHMQAAIGDQLHSELEVPRSFPPKMGALVIRLAVASNAFNRLD
jgi:ABC-type uncharacterized transport system permease subunit